MADWETYADAADRLGMTADAVRHRARRLAWRRMRANDGKTLVMVPDDVEPTDRQDDPPMSERASTGPSPDRSPDHVSTIDILQARVAELRHDLERERAERLAERDRADKLSSQLADAFAQLAATLDQVKDAASIRASFDAAKAQLAEAKALHAAELEKVTDTNRAEAERARAELEAWRSRPWWKRIAG